MCQCCPSSSCSATCWTRCSASWLHPDPAARRQSRQPGTSNAVHRYAAETACGQPAKPLSPPAQPFILYEFESCPYCAKEPLFTAIKPISHSIPDPKQHEALSTPSWTPSSNPPQERPSRHVPIHPPSLLPLSSSVPPLPPPSASLAPSHPSTPSQAYSAAQRSPATVRRCLNAHQTLTLRDTLVSSQLTSTLTLTVTLMLNIYPYRLGSKARWQACVPLLRGPE